MKRLIMLILLVLFTKAHGQGERKQVIITFDQKHDSIAAENGIPKRFYLYNLNYKKESQAYNTYLEDRKSFFEENRKRGIIAFYPKHKTVIKPNRYYCFSTEKVVVSETECNDLQKQKYYSREKLNILSPYRTDIYIINYTDGNCYKARFFPNVTE